MPSSSVDSSALLAFVFEEAGHEKVLDLFEKATASGRKVFIAAPNWAEVCYKCIRRVGRAQWQAARTMLLKLPLEIVPADDDLAERAGELKSVHKISLADCFAAALAERENAHFYTRDPDFRAMEPALKVVWI